MMALRPGIPSKARSWSSAWRALSISVRERAISPAMSAMRARMTWLSARVMA